MKEKTLNLDALDKFIKRYEQAITGRSKELRLSIEEAGLISAALSSLLIEKLSNLEKQPEIQIEETVEVRLDAGNFKDE